MSDRELLMLAAKAYGASLSDYSDGTPDHLEIECSDGVWREWKPLADDGDALRMAVRLDMHVDVNRVDGFTRVIYGYRSQKTWVEYHEEDPYAATRRAIARAAAEIGRNMP